MKRSKKDINFYECYIQEIFSECTHGLELDIEEFENKITGLQAAALIDGVDLETFKSLVRQCTACEGLLKTFSKIA